MARTVPGTFIRNTATLVGLKMGSIGYGLVAVAGVVTALLIAYLADRYVRPYLGSPSLQEFEGNNAAVIGIILATGLRMMHSAVIDGRHDNRLAGVCFVLFTAVEYGSRHDFHSLGRGGVNLFCLLAGITPIPKNYFIRFSNKAVKDII